MSMRPVIYMDYLMLLDHTTSLRVLRKTLTGTPLRWKPFFSTGGILCGVEALSPDEPSIYLAGGRWHVSGQRESSGRIRSWLLDRIVKAWHKAYEYQMRFHLTSEEELLLEAELGEAALMAQFAALEASERRERAKMEEAPVVNGFFKGVYKHLQGRK